jgi:putative tricarboxylic transport membrane protein
MIFSAAFFDFLLLISGSILSRYATKVTVIPVSILAPTIITLGVISTYAIRSQPLDVMVAIVAGIVGYLMKRFGYNTIPFLVAFILSPIAEKSYHQALMLSEGSYATFVLRPISGIFFVLIVIVLVWPFISKRLKKGKTG